MLSSLDESEEPQNLKNDKQHNGINQNSSSIIR